MANFSIPIPAHSPKLTYSWSDKPTADWPFSWGHKSALVREEHYHSELMQPERRVILGEYPNGVAAFRAALADAEEQGFGFYLEEA